MATPSLILVPSKYKIGTLYTEVATTSAGTVLGSLGDFSVTRASVATRVNSQGLIETIPAVTNLAWHSHLWVSGNNWVNTAVTVVTGTSGTTDPFGTNLANAISPTSGSSSHIAQSNSPTTIAYNSGTIYTQSAFFKQGTGVAGRYVQMTFPGVGNSFTQLGYANFDLQLGTVAIVTGITADTNRSARIENYGNGWYRCQFTATAAVSAGGAGVAAILITSSGDTRAFPFSGTTTDILYGFGAQLEAGSSASPYVATTTAAVTNSIPRIDYYTSSGTVGCPALLVEPAGTNLALQSEAFNTTWSPVQLLAFNSGSVINTTGTLDPYGTNVADLIVPNTTLNQHRLDQTTVSASGSYTFSVFVKRAGYDFARLRIGLAGASFNLASGTITATDSGIVSAIQSYGNDWYRCIVSKAVSAANEVIRINVGDSALVPDFQGNGTSGLYVFGAQYETGSVATSYIPTTTASATRNADVINVTGAVSGCIGQTEGTIYWDIAYVGGVLTGTGNPELGVRNQAFTNWIGLTSNSPSLPFRISARTTTTANPINYSANITSGKAALAWSSAGLVLYVNGVSVATSATNPNFSFSRVDIGNTSSMPFKANAFALYTTRLTNEELELLTYPTYYSNVRDLIWGTFAARNSTFSELQSCLQTRHNQLIIV